MGLLSELEERYGGEVRQALQGELQQRLRLYRPLCPTCGLAMHRHGSYPRNIVTRHGILSLDIPMFLCPNCQATTSGITAVGVEEVRQRFSKRRKPRL